MNDDTRALAYHGGKHKDSTHEASVDAMNDDAKAAARLGAKNKDATNEASVEPMYGRPQSRAERRHESDRRQK